MRAVAYLRVSSVSQVDGHSLDAQERLFYELCKNRGWEAVKIYREEGRSAHVEAIARRPVFRQLLEDAAKDRGAAIYIAPLSLCTDNAVMGGIAWERLRSGRFDDLSLDVVAGLVR